MGRAGSGGSGIGDPRGDIAMLVQGGRGCVCQRKIHFAQVLLAQLGEVQRQLLGRDT